ncbi:polysaccharide pyruvyl transferase family protein [Anaeromicropila herbilytica]|uniref:Polysaccharide pyruvyl transferase domain-containing protein n=1 Tax=Anaeromicropila herbilytica TaxID=2785025 RepID=A0A7R7ENK3_9FIRM|nr:polysaccharide pyruvyl transferase family protein [Anaeromicropila herbilytica]BCN31787.1 hypothetical protein bsdtb5_30820 [Anaeromicropila herbilytica]
MRRILMRSGMSPFENLDPVHIMLNNSIGGNVGNLIYAYSLYRNLTTEDTVIEADHYIVDPSKANEINENYDAYIIPLADAFREDFVTELRNYTKLIEQLTIPVFVIGVGLRASIEPKLEEGFPFDDDVKKFVTVVLHHSGIIGVRGQITADYLSRLGFKEGRDHMVIGCPSMYTFGSELKIRETSITRDSKVSINNSKLSPKNVLTFIKRSTEEFPDHYFIPQWLKEMKLTYLGISNAGKPTPNYPYTITDKLYQEGRVLYFYNAPTWINFLKTVDLSFGARFHGNIAATIAGTPSIIIPKDARMRELAEFHKLTYIFSNDITDQTNIWNVIEKADFQSPCKVQAQNFMTFLEFLNRNGIDHIYKNTLTPDIVPFDESVKAVKYAPPIVPITMISQFEMSNRFQKYFELSEEIHIEQKLAINSLKRELYSKNIKLNKIEGTLNRKSIKFTISCVNKVKHIIK